MADRPLKLRDLRKILRRFDVAEDTSRGSGSHTLFYKQFSDGTFFSYPIPTHGSDVVLVCYVKGCRKKFRLSQDDGVSDKEFYGK
jgi:hypothetical protein